MGGRAVLGRDVTAEERAQTPGERVIGVCRGGATALCQFREDVLERKAVVRWNAKRLRAGDGL